MLQTAVSHPAPLISTEAALSATFVLDDFISGAYPSSNAYRLLIRVLAMSAGTLRTNTVTPPLFRPPEVYLEAEWGTQVGIWSFGCIVCVIHSSSRHLADRHGQAYDAVTSLPPSLYTTNAQSDLTEVESMPCQMISITDDVFRASQLSVSPQVIDCFDPENSTFFFSLIMLKADNGQRRLLAQESDALGVVV
jgi:hypothetical protein